jgi:hypothetical protein
MRRHEDHSAQFAGGDAFRFIGRRTDPHPWVVLSSPEGAMVLIANFTEWLAWKDQTCVVEPAEFPGVLALKSCVHYFGCQVWTAGTFEDQIDQGRIQIAGRASDTLLARMRKGVIDSSRASYEAKDVILAQDLATE